MSGFTIFLGMYVQFGFDRFVSLLNTQQTIPQQNSLDISSLSEPLPSVVAAVATAGTSKGIDAIQSMASVVSRAEKAIELLWFAKVELPVLV